MAEAQVKWSPTLVPCCFPTRDCVPFSCSPELRTRAQIIDRFLERQLVARSRLQLVGVTGLMLASKYEEIYPPEVHSPNQSPLGVARTKNQETYGHTFQQFWEDCNCLRAT